MKIPRRSEVFVSVTGFLDAHNIPYTVVRRKKHMQLHYEHNGQQFKQTFSPNKSDGHARWNALADVKRAIYGRKDDTNDT